MRSSWPAYARVADAMTFTLPMMLLRLNRALKGQRIHINLEPDREGGLRAHVLGDHVLHLENVSSQSLTTEPLSAVCPAALPNDAQTEAWRT
ncbi:MAG TPA: hypothetical protein VIR54_00360 [Vicinamibacterales bacterium]|jgi:hypothetical protein